MCDYCFEESTLLIETCVDNELYNLCVNCYMDEKGGEI